MGHHHRVIELLKLLHNTAGSNAQVRLWNITPNKLCKIHYFVHYFNPTNNDFNMFLFKTKTSRDIRDMKLVTWLFMFVSLFFCQVFRSLLFGSLSLLAKFSVHNFVHYFFLPSFPFTILFTIFFCQVFRSLFCSLFFFAKFSVHYFFTILFTIFFCQVFRSLFFSLFCSLFFFAKFHVHYFFTNFGSEI